MEKAIIVDMSPVKESPSLIGMGLIFEQMTKVRIGSDLNMAAGRKLADEQLAETISDKITRDFILMNLVKNEDGRYTYLTPFVYLILKH